MMRHQSSRRFCNAAVAFLGLSCTGAAAGATVPDAVSFLTASQSPDGRWESPAVRTEQATAEALQALQALQAAAPGEAAARAAAVSFLAAHPILDSDDLAQRLLALAGEGQDVAALAAGLRDARDPLGGWGLAADFAADPLDTALALQALAARPELGDEPLRAAVLRLLVSQRADGGFPCVDAPPATAASEVYCTAHALLALAPLRSRFHLEAEVARTAGFLQAQRAAEGRFGPAGPAELIQTAVAARALAATGSFGQAVPQVTAFLAGRQQPDGSWDGDPFTTAAVVRTLHVLAGLPFCGDGLLNAPGEACDGSVPAGATCTGLGLGPGTLACTASCTFDSSGCTAAPRCGDGVRNQPFEVCDGTDLAGASCDTLGFAAGSLACAAGCMGFDVSGCSQAPVCGDGVINQAGETCDLSDLGGLTCETLGLGGGALSCATDCQLATALCNDATAVIDNQGREFFVGFLPQLRDGAQPQIFLTGDVPATVNVQYPAGSPSFAQSVAVTPGQVTTVTLPATAHTAWPLGTAFDNAVRISSDEEVAAHLVNVSGDSSDGSLALPVDALGTFYLVNTYPSTASISEDRSEILIVAPFGPTQVTITPTAALRRPAPHPDAPAGVPWQIVLGRGEGFLAYAAAGGADLTGTAITSDRPVAVFTGSICTEVPARRVACDHLFEAEYPVATWGTTALVANLPSRPGGSYYRVVAAEDATEVFLDGSARATLGRGEVFEIGPLTGNHVFTASRAIQVSQFMTGIASPGANLGDPSMVRMVPPEQFLDAYTFSTVAGRFPLSYLTVIARTSSIGAVLLDGNPIAASAFTAIPGTAYAAAVLPVTDGSHTTAAPEPHGISVSGIGNFNSYLFGGGSRFEIVNPTCGDGRINLAFEQCDGGDFQGATCAGYGFSAGMLRCTPACAIDTGGCSGLPPRDQDQDGFLVPADCDDHDASIHPGRPEIPGNGVDDDCNPATPDALPAAALSCGLTADRLLYTATDTITLEARVINGHATVSAQGLEAVLAVRLGAAAPVHDETRALAPLPPGGRAEPRFAFPAVGRSPGTYQADLDIRHEGQKVAACAVSFTVESSAVSGAGLHGELIVEPRTVQAGETPQAVYRISNLGNAELADLALRILLVDPASGEAVRELETTATLLPDAAVQGAQPVPTGGLAPGSYQVVLLARTGDAGEERMLAHHPLDVTAAAVVVEIPTLGELGLAVMALLLASGALVLARRAG